MEWAEWPLVTRRRFNNLSVKCQRLRLEIEVAKDSLRFETNLYQGKVNQLIEAKDTIQDLRMDLIEANAELLDQKVGGML